MCKALKGLTGIWKFCNKQDTFSTLINSVSCREPSSYPEIVKEVHEVLSLCVLCVILSVPVGPALFFGVLRYMVAHVICKTEKTGSSCQFFPTRKVEFKVKTDMKQECHRNNNKKNPPVKYLCFDLNCMNDKSVTGWFLSY